MKTFNYKKCIKEIREIKNDPLYNYIGFSDFKKQIERIVIQTIKENIKEVDYIFHMVNK